MPPPLSAYVEAAKRFAKISSDDVAVIEDFYVRVFPGLATSKKEKILAYILAHEGPARSQPEKQPIAIVTMSPMPQSSRPQVLGSVPTITNLPSFFGAPPWHIDDPDHCAHGWTDGTQWGVCDCEDPANPWPSRVPGDGPRDCMCFGCHDHQPRHERGRLTRCEYKDHHCEDCHENQHCTAMECRFWR